VIVSMLSSLRRNRWAHFAATLIRHPNLGIVRNALGSPPWHHEPNVKPWFDQPDALEVLSNREMRGELTAEEARLFRAWVEEGYFVLDDALETDEIDRFNAAVDGLAEAAEPHPKIRFLGMRKAAGLAEQELSHAELLSLAPEERQRMMSESNWRIHALHAFNPHARRLFDNPRIRDLVSKLFGEPARPFASITFQRGSEQGLHQDMAVFHIYPHNYLVGVWFACEDISPAAGPLVVLPKSHRAELFPAFEDYPQTNLRTVSPALQRQYDLFAEEIASRFQAVDFVARKGQALFWHGMLLHGGAHIGDPRLTRRAFVVHFDVARASRETQVLGPFNW
jgi:ectoine hydroxylase-related dioxygenase (phytanoyl-CoA dioxygenase family)